MKHLTCKEVVAKIYLCLDRELPEDELAELSSHIDRCAGCLERFGVEQEFKELIRHRCRESAPEELVIKIRTALEREAQ